jgi:hypothetical protein
MRSIATLFSAPLGITMSAYLNPLSFIDELTETPTLMNVLLRWEAEFLEGRLNQM